MATKTIVRYEPPNELIGRRSLTVADMEHIGIFTQKKDLNWDREKGFWLDADEAGIAPEVMERLESEDFSNDGLGHFKVEKQEVEDKPVSGSEGVGGASTPAATTRKVKDNPQA